MKTNRRRKRKINLIAPVLVGIVVLVIFQCVRIGQLEKEIESLALTVNSLSGNATHASTEYERNPSVDGVTVSDGDSEPVIPVAIVTDKPMDISGAEPEAKHKVYLTFDDGPSKNTEAILDILDEYGVKATFFVVGKEDEKAQERLQMIYERGHTIGMHSYSHDYTKIYESEEAFRADFLKSKQYIFDAIGVETTHYRFPGGSSNSLSDLSMQVFVDFLEEQGMEYYDWNISSGDGSSILIPAETILENCTAKISRYDTSIVLMHDSASKSTTVEALPQIIETIQAMEDTVILPITENTNPVHHTIKEK